jgi:hypothetical protein
MFEAVLSDACSREDADRWAGQWVYAADSEIKPGPKWQALTRLAGCDLRHGPGLPYLHTNEQIQEWLAEFRQAGEGDV